MNAAQETVAFSAGDTRAAGNPNYTTFAVPAEHQSFVAAIAEGQRFIFRLARPTPLAAPVFADDTGDAIAGTVGTAIAAVTVPAATGNPASTYAVVGNLPAGLNFNTGTRVLSGTPTAAGSGTITIRATNSEGDDDWTVAYSFSAALAAPVFADDTGDAIAGTVGTAIAAVTVPAATGNPASTYAVVGKPAGRAQLQHRHPRPQRDADGGRLRHHHHPGHEQRGRRRLDRRLQLFSGSGSPRLCRRHRRRYQRHGRDGHCRRHGAGGHREPRLDLRRGRKPAGRAQLQHRHPRPQRDADGGRLRHHHHPGHEQRGATTTGPSPTAFQRLWQPPSLPTTPETLSAERSGRPLRLSRCRRPPGTPRPPTPWSATSRPAPPSTLIAVS